MKNSLVKKVTLLIAMMLLGIPFLRADTILSYTSPGDIGWSITTNAAQRFTMGTTSFAINTVSLDMMNVPDPFSNFAVGIYSDVAGVRGSLLESLTYLSTGTSQDGFGYPFQTVEFAGSGVLNANESYWLEISNPADFFIVEWFNVTTLGTASYGSFSESPYATAGLTVTGTAVPEPSIYALLGLGALGLAVAYRRVA